MRDPRVIQNPVGEGWLMYFTAPVPGRTEPNAGGAVGFATSPDLVNWALQKPIYDGGDFGQLEVPQVFKFGKKWYRMFCTAVEHWSEGYRSKNTETPVTGSHYLIANSHLGPWMAPTNKFLDGRNPCDRYAGKIVEKDDGLFIMGFLYYDIEGNFIGKVSDPIPLRVDDNSLLSV